MFPGRYSEIFGLGERLGCVLNLGSYLFPFSWAWTLSRAVAWNMYSRGDGKCANVYWPITI